MKLPRPLRAWVRYHRDAFDLDGAKRRAQDIRVLLDAARHGPRGAAPVASPPKALRASALAAYTYGSAALLAYGGVLWQLWMLSGSAAVTGAWALAGFAFAVQALAAAARHWRLRTGRQGGVGDFLDSPGPHWPRVRS